MQKIVSRCRLLSFVETEKERATEKRKEERGGGEGEIKREK